MCGLVSAHAKYLSVFCILCKLGCKVDINSASTEFCNDLCLVCLVSFAGIAPRD